MIFLEGVIIGLTLALVLGFGPSFFTLIQTSIDRGFKSAMFLDLGIILNDVVIVALLLMTNIQFNIKDEKNLLFSGIGAGIILIIFGIYTYTLSPSKIKSISDNNNQVIDRINEKFDDDVKWYTYIARGFIINIFNPFVWIFWITCVATASGNYEGNRLYLIIFFLGTFSTVLFFDILKALGAYSLQRFFTEKMLKILNQVTGVALIISGLYIMVRVIFFPFSF